MKILWLSHLIPYPPKGGVLQRSYNLIHQLAGYHDVDLLAFIQRSFMESHFTSYDTGISESMAALSTFSGRVQFLPIPCESHYAGKHRLAVKSLFTSFPYSINWLKSKAYQQALATFIRESPYDLVHFDTISLAPYRQQTGNIPAVLDHHNIESHMMLRRAAREKNPLLKGYYYQEGIRLQRYERQHCRGFGLHITCSDLDSERLTAVDDQIRVRTIPNGVDLSYFLPKEVSPVPKSLIFAGSMNWYPNVEAVIFFVQKVWPLLKQEAPNCRLHLIGASPPEIIRNYNADPAIEVHGFVDDVRPHLEQAAVYICPIRDGGGTKLKLLDAFAMKKAVVAHPVACEGISAKPEREVLLAEQPEEFVRQIQKLFNNEPLRLSLGENARRLVAEHYSYDLIGKQLSDSYEQFAEQCHTGRGQG